jgi:hypothetical protein
MARDKTIWKFPLVVEDVITFEGPAHLNAKHVGLDPKGVPCLWAAVDPDTKTIKHRVYCFGTGHPLPEKLGAYLGTVTLGVLVLHFYLPDG